MKVGGGEGETESEAAVTQAILSFPRVSFPLTEGLFLPAKRAKEGARGTQGRKSSFDKHVVKRVFWFLCLRAKDAGGVSAFP